MSNKSRVEEILELKYTNRTIVDNEKSTSTFDNNLSWKEMNERIMALGFMYLMNKLVKFFNIFLNNLIK